MAPANYIGPMKGGGKNILNIKYASMPSQFCATLDYYILYTQ